MSTTVLDASPYFAYARYLNKVNQKDILPLVSNMDKEPMDMKVSFPPRLVKFGSQIFIAGAVGDVKLGSCFLRDNPDIEYAVEVYEDPELVKERYLAMFGNSYEAIDFDNEDVKPKPEESLEESNPIMNMYEIIRAKNDVAIYLKSFLVNYVNGRTKVDKAPYLVGHSGVSKSSIVYSVIEELDDAASAIPLADLIKNSQDNKEDWGFRMVEVRAGFLDKTDLLGYASDTEVKGESAWTDSPKKELLLCTTEFVNQCRNWIKSLKDEDITPENMHMINKMRFYAKTPVLFLDEVNRSPQIILNQLMILINSHRLNGYFIDVAPKICAANELVDMDDLPEGAAEMFDYAVNEVVDIAVASRFNKLVVSGNDVSVVQSTLRHLKRIYADSPTALKALDWAAKNKKLYDHKSVDAMGKFPTFRGWEELCKYLSWVEKSEGVKPLLDIVQSLVGSSLNGSKLFPLIEDSLGREFDSSHSTNSFLRHSIDSGLPCALLGRLGVAKTAKLNKYAKESGAIVEFIDLSAEDRTTVNGYPDKQSFLKTVFKDVVPSKHRKGVENYSEEEDINVINTDLFKNFEKSLQTNHKIPKETTVCKPHESILNKIQQVKEQAKAGKKVKLVLFFDEINRSNPIVQSSIFEAISLKRYRGISLEGIDFSVVTAGNWQRKSEIENGNVHYIVEPIDTATLHRFASKFIEEVNEEDVRDFMNFLEEKHPLAYGMFEKLYKQDPAKLRELLNYLPDSETAELNKIFTDVFTFREVTDLECKIKEYDFDVTSGMSFEDLNKIILVLRSPHYIMHNSGFREDIMTWEHGEDLRALYIKPRQKEINVSQFANLSADLLADKKIDKEVKVNILTLIKFIESELFAFPLKFMTDNIPKNAKVKDVVVPLIHNAYSSRTLARVQLDQLEYNIFGSKDDALIAIKKLLESAPPDQIVSVMLQNLIYSVKESKEKIPLSKIVQAIKVFNETEESNQSVKKLSVLSAVNSLSDYSHNIKYDYTEKVKYDLKDILNENIDKDNLEIIKKYIIFPDLADTKETAGLLLAGYHHLDHDHIVPDLFTLYVVSAGGPNNFNRSVTFDDHIFKCSIKKSNDEIVNYTYTGLIGMLDLTITAEVHNQIQDKPSSKVLSDDVLDNPDLLVQKNLSSLAGAMKTIEVHGGSLEDVPDFDKSDVSKLKNTSITVKSSERVKHDKSANLAMIFKRSFNGIEKLFQ